MRVIATNLHACTVDIPVEIIGHGTVQVSVTATEDLNALLPEADFISLHVPKQADGSAVLDEAEFELMKKGVIVINAARGGVINENALLKAIQFGKVAFAGLDVFENEPNPMKELLANDAIGTTPHIGAATVEAQDRIGLELANQIIGVFGEKIPA